MACRPHRSSPGNEVAAALVTAVCLTGVAVAQEPGQGAAPAPAANLDRPNVLFVSIDDLNDWIEPLGGHPQARTPHLRRLAERSVLFTRAYCPSPGCNPSRTAVMTGRAPYRDGSEELYDHDRNPEEWTNLAGDPSHRAVADRMALQIPRDPAPLVRTSQELQPHHIPPFRSRADCDEWKAHGRDFGYLLERYWQ